MCPDPVEIQKQQQAEEEARQKENEERDRIAKQVQPIFAKLAKQSGYKPQIIDWGGGKVLTAEVNSYRKLSPDEKQLVEDYAKTQRLKAFIIGRKVDADTLMMDDTIWGY
jgi:hypothetical protein